MHFNFKHVKYVFFILECHWRAFASWTRRSGFLASGLVCGWSVKERIWPKCGAQTDLTSAGFRFALERKERWAEEEEVMIKKCVKKKHHLKNNQRLSSDYLVPVRCFASDWLKRCSIWLPRPDCPTWSRPFEHIDPGKMEKKVWYLECIYGVIANKNNKKLLHSMSDNVQLVYLKVQSRPLNHNFLTRVIQ